MQAILSLPQRESLVQLLLAREGMVTLARPDVSRVLALNAEQREEIKRILASRTKALETGSDLQKQIATRRFERQLQALLTKSQAQRSLAMPGHPGP